MISLREAWSRLRGSLGFGRRVEDFAEELRFHQEMLEEQHQVRGLDAAAARRAARIELGAGPQLQERWRDQRGLPALEMLWQDIRYGLRMLARAPGFTTAAVLTLALGIGANTTIFTVVDAVLLRQLPYADPDRLVTVGDRGPDGMSSNVGFTTLVDWRARSRTFESFALMRSWAPTLVTGGEAEQVPAVRVSWNYFDVMGARPALGRMFTPDEDRPDHWRVLLLSDELWRRRFGADPSIVGRTLVMNDREYRVIGVMPATFDPLDAERYYQRAQLWAPIGYDISLPEACRGCRHLRAFGRLKGGVTVDQATAEMNTIRQQLRAEHPTDYDAGAIAIVPLREALTRNVRTALLVLLGAVGLVLLIACANVASLLLARSVSRQRELALRAALGAGRGRIVRQLLTESAMLSGLGAAAGVLLASLSAQAIVALAPVSLPRSGHLAIDARVLAFTAGVAVLSALIFGLLPAWRHASGTRAHLSGSRTYVAGRSRARGALVVADLVFALVLLAAAGAMLRTVVALTHASPGFDPARVLTLQFSLVGKAYAEDPQVAAFQDRFLEKVAALPGVEAAAVASQVPLGGNGDCWGFHARGRTKPNTADDPCIERYGVTPDYLRVRGIPLRAGRFFSGEDRAGSQPVIVVSESTARATWGAGDPIGAEVRIGDAQQGPWRRVIGVVGDTHHEDVTAAPTPAMYTPESQVTDSFLVAGIKMSSAPAHDATTLIGPVRGVLRELDPAVPVYDVATMGARLTKSSAQRLFVMRLLSGFACVAVLLAALGLYGVVSHDVAQRTREVGVRVALGATRADVVRLILAQGSTVVVAGVGGGLAAALLAMQYLQSLVYGVSPTDPGTLAGAAGILILVAIAAHALPLRRALRIDPAVALRHE